MILFVASLVLLITLLIRGQPKGNHPQSTVYWLAATTKVGAGLAVAGLYGYYYGEGDTVIYFSNATRLSQLAREDFFQYISFLWKGDTAFPVWEELDVRQHRSLFMVKLTSIVCLVTNDHYWLSAVYFSLFSFFGAWYFCRIIGDVLHGSLTPAFIAFLFYPSVVFWTSGILKEALAFPCILFLSATVVQVWKKGRLHWREMLLVPLAVVLVWKLKYFYLGIFLPLAFTVTLFGLFRHRMRRPLPTSVALVICILIFFAGLWGATTLHPNFDMLALPKVVALNHQMQVAQSAPGRYIDFGTVEPNWMSVAENIPEAIFGGLFRPQPWESQGTAMILASVENFLLLLFTLVAIAAFLKRRSEPEPFLLGAMFLYVAMSCTLITLATPNFGTLTRYRIGYLPFFVWAIADAVLPYLKKVSFKDGWNQNPKP